MKKYSFLSLLLAALLGPRWRCASRCGARQWSPCAGCPTSRRPRPRRRGVHLIALVLQIEFDPLDHHPFVVNHQYFGHLRILLSVELTAKEFDLMALLMQNPGRVYSRENLLNLVWGYEYIGEFL